MLKTTPRFPFGLLFIALLSLCFFGFWASTGFSQKKEAFIIEMDSAISSGTAGFLSEGIQEAQKRGSELIVIRLDTSGGLGASMKSMVKEIMNSPIPVVVYVAPKGAGAASAGVLITVAAHVAAMAPGTNIGAAHPVGQGGEDIKGAMGDKVLNDAASYGRSIAQEKGRNAEWIEKAIRNSVSITANEAVQYKVVDLVAEDINDLLKLLDGRQVTLNKEKITLHTKDLDQYFYRPSFRDKVLGIISDPTIIALLMMIGMAGIGFEIYNPGLIFPGVVGAISIILAFYGMQTLPVNYAGLLLMALAVIFFIAEIKVSSYGLLALGGTVSFILGSIMLFEDVAAISLKFLIAAGVIVGGSFMVMTALVIRAHRSKIQSGEQGLMGEIGVVKQALDPEGIVFVHGELWKAVADEKISEGEKVIVEKIQGLVLKVGKKN